jgi:hypothetical protein
VDFALDLALENFLGYGREFLPARELNAQIGKPRTSRGFLPPIAFGIGLFAADSDATRAAAFSA